MSHLYEQVYKKRKYYDRALCNDYEDWLNKIQYSKTVYIGNLSIYTTEQQIYEHMNKAGDVENIIMGLHRTEKSPCGFCFVVYKKKEGATQSVNFLNNSILDGRIIRVDEDLGVIGKRKYGRGKTGVQKRDERNKHFDEDRPVVLDNLAQHLITKKRKINNNSYHYSNVYNIYHPYERNVKPRILTNNNFYPNNYQNSKSVNLKPVVTLYPNVQHLMTYNRNKNNNPYNYNYKKDRKPNM
ncbi:nuclear cap-binding protein, putative [Plasmodium berghei]|uniref:Nuclear cap-binding protein subunit 2 n=2 Tax=Plasmodium berghei TaxID=5821 RepID=A0A509AIB2_PLABA|nr:nuclear cap-binding protein subunit 2, putative [Plasmodium berghei ANKA]CXI26390.1 nuclear cap-binding protein, putative [Plasmodium berghei]SCM20494.1 nuclear cap-binding protein, putative [Plasmodium berghei]SCN24075.1 nuclear cap-binding protein, putative [Plasmodium berghei]SCO59383.1 nuclear cap-binding protein, putative [Plasmodium berghei]SCO60552.1 nuclear cap-binding protein, putative [Plasmodium berghei]|eukprot:XP_034420920.1 nuclear cap-binding protein subunit 2, putative [Plasmodium berghei ANKA]